MEINYLQTKGAVNVENNLYTLAEHATKNDKYKCPECNDNVFIKKGDFKIVHYCHYNNKRCDFYDNRNKHNEHYVDLHTHKHAQTLFKKIYDDNVKIIINDECDGCHVKTHIKTIQKMDNYKCVLEHPYKYNESNKKIDCAILDDNDKLIDIIEIYNTHKTDIKDRPYFIEINALHVITAYYNLKNDCMNLKSTKEYLCKPCDDHRLFLIDKHNALKQENEKRLIREHELKQEIKRKEEEQRIYYEELRKENIRKDEEARRIYKEKYMKEQKLKQEEEQRIYEEELKNVIVEQPIVKPIVKPIKTHKIKKINLNEHDFNCVEHSPDKDLVLHYCMKCYNNNKHLFY